MSDAPLIYVDLIEDEPFGQDDWYEDEGGVTKEGDFFADDKAIEDAYKQYLEHFQPWRVLIISGGNHEPLFKSTEAYFNEADARHAAELAFGKGSNVYLRQSERGNVELRMATE